MNKEFINPDSLPNWEQTFSQIVIVSNDTSKTVYLSWQVSVDENQNLIGEGDLRVQALRALQNLDDALAAAVAKTMDVVKLNVYINDYNPDVVLLVGSECS